MTPEDAALVRSLQLAATVARAAAWRTWPAWQPGVSLATGMHRVYAEIGPLHDCALETMGSGRRRPASRPVPLASILLRAEEDQQAALASHMALWDPHLVLHLIQAVTALVRLHQPAEPPYAWMCAVCGDEGQTRDCTFPCDTRRILADGLEPLLALAGPPDASPAS